MKEIMMILVCMLLFSCGNNIDERIYGDWKAKTRFYQANYQIDDINGKIVGKVLNYDDGTTRYKWDVNQPRYIFQNLKSSDAIFVDAISGATAKADNRNIEIEILHEDTLNATIYISNHPKSEIWTRIK